MAYTNTTALKGDITRTGKRNMKGVINDGAASLMRLYQNNFKDGNRQMVVDFFLGLQSWEALTGRTIDFDASGVVEAAADSVQKEHADASTYQANV